MHAKDSTDDLFEGCQCFPNMGGYYSIAKTLHSKIMDEDICLPLNYLVFLTIHQTSHELPYTLSIHAPLGFHWISSCLGDNVILPHQYLTFVSKLKVVFKLLGW